MAQQQQPPPQSPPIARHVTAGLISGIASAVILQPFDFVKTRVQQSSNTSIKNVWNDISGNPFRLWRGTIPSALRTGIGSALYFTSLNAVRQQFAKTKSLSSSSSSSSSSSVLPKLDPLDNLISGAGTRGAVGFIMMPLTVIKAQYESSFYHHKSIFGAVKNIYHQNGIKGLFTGFGATFIRDAPYAGLYIVFYDKFKLALCSVFDYYGTTHTTTSHNFLSPTQSAIVNALSAASSASLATTITNPFDTVKTNMQIQPLKYKSLTIAFKILIFERGFKGLFDGLALRISRKALSSGIAWCVYEELLK